MTLDLKKLHCFFLRNGGKIEKREVRNIWDFQRKFGGLF